MSQNYKDFGKLFLEIGIKKYDMFIFKNDTRSFLSCSKKLWSFDECFINFIYKIN